MAFLGGALGFIGGAVDIIQGIAGNSKDQERFAWANQLRDLALQGDSRSYWQLRCLSGDNSQRVREMGAQFQFLKAGDGPCGFATADARAYAKAKLAEVDARVQIASASGIITLISAKVGSESAPGPYIQTVAPALAATGLAGIPPVLFWGVGAVAIFLLIRKGR
jgi:hypothetical protein